MALSQADKAFIAALIADAITPAIVAPATPVAHERTFATKEDRLAGKGFPCTADDGIACDRADLRTPKRAAAHGVDGHYPKANIAVA